MKILISVLTIKIIKENRVLKFELGNKYPNFSYILIINKSKKQQNIIQ